MSPHGQEKRIALICASNQNRSVEAHALLKSKGYKNVYSYGTGSKCKLPGPSIDKPNVYRFGTPYRQIFEELRAQNAELYKSNGILSMLERNMRVKEAPERFQESTLEFDIIITFEDRVYDAVLEDLSNRGSQTGHLVHVFNIQTKDNHDEATIGATHALQLVRRITEEENWEDDLDAIMEDFTRKTSREILHNVMFY